MGRQHTCTSSLTHISCRRYLDHGARGYVQTLHPLSLYSSSQIVLDVLLNPVEEETMPEEPGDNRDFGEDDDYDRINMSEDWGDLVFSQGGTTIIGGSLKPAQPRQPPASPLKPSSSRTVHHRPVDTSQFPRPAPFVSAQAGSSTPRATVLSPQAAQRKGLKPYPSSSKAEVTSPSSLNGRVGRGGSGSWPAYVVMHGTEPGVYYDW